MYYYFKQLKAAIHKVANRLSKKVDEPVIFDLVREVLAETKDMNKGVNKSNSQKPCIPWEATWKGELVDWLWGIFIVAVLVLIAFSTVLVK